MRCPKCQYISFGSAARCRNCGYDFSLAQDLPPQDLPIQTGNEPLGPLQDLPLAGRAGQPGHADLPLFAGRSAPEDAPLVTPPAVPRPPLAVRRTSPVSARARSRPAPADDLEFDIQPPTGSSSSDELLIDDSSPVAPSKAPVAPASRVATPTERPACMVRAPRGARLLAGAIDLLLVGGIDAAVVYFTLRLCGLSVEEIGILPKVPLVGFLLLLNGGYFVLFTAAGGQTIGKMTAGVRVVMDPEGEHPVARVTFQAALLRGIGYFLALLPAGIGLLPALLSSDGRGLHDHVAGTRVVKA